MIVYSLFLQPFAEYRRSKIADREDDYKKRRMNRQLNLGPTSYRERMIETALEREHDVLSLTTLDLASEAVRLMHLVAFILQRVIHEVEKKKKQEKEEAEKKLKERQEQLKEMEKQRKKEEKRKRKEEKKKLKEERKRKKRGTEGDDDSEEEDKEENKDAKEEKERKKRKKEEDEEERQAERRQITMAAHFKHQVSSC